MAERTAFGLSTIGQIALPTQDVERALEFYRDRLGMRFLFRAGPLLFFDCGGVRLMLSPPEPGFEHHASVLYYTVDDIRAAHETLSSRGVSFRDAPHKIADLGTRELWMSFFDDQEGNVLAIMSEIAKS